MAGNEPLERFICPCCGESYSLAQLQADDSARRFLTLTWGLPLKLRTELGNYIKLFAPPKAAMGWARRHVRLEESLGLEKNPVLLAEALHRCNSAQVEKKRDGTFRQFKNHRYLEKILESVRAEQGISQTAPDKTGAAAKAAPKGSAESGKKGVAALRDTLKRRTA